MNCEELTKQLPSHWQLELEDYIDPLTGNTDRDYDLPCFRREDGLAHIYFNLNPSNDCVFSIKFDYHNDSQCMLTLAESIAFADSYIAQYPLEYNKCICGVIAVWWYAPMTDNTQRFYCAEHVPRGCSCNISPNGEEELEDVNGVLRLLPCCEYWHVEFGYPIEKS